MTDKNSNKVRLTLVPTAGKKLRFQVAEMTTIIGHAFGPDSRYKGRNVEQTLTLEPQNVVLDVVGGESSDFDLADVVALIVGSQVVACEAVVAEALEREREEEERIRNLAHGSTEAKPFNSP